MCHCWVKWINWLVKRFDYFHQFAGYTHQERLNCDSEWWQRFYSFHWFTIVWCESIDWWKDLVLFIDSHATQAPTKFESQFIANWIDPALLYGVDSIFALSLPHSLSRPLTTQDCSCKVSPGSLNFSPRAEVPLPLGKWLVSRWMHSGMQQKVQR